MCKPSQCPYAGNLKTAGIVCSYNVYMIYDTFSDLYIALWHKNKITHSNEVLWCFNICTHVEYLNYSKPLTLHILPMKKMFNILPSSAMRYKVHGCPVDKKNLRKLRTIYTAKEINQTSEKEAHNRKDSLSANLSENYYSEYIKNWKNQKQKYQQ